MLYQDVSAGAWIPSSSPTWFWPSTTHIGGAEDIEAAPAAQQDKCLLTMQEAEAIDEEAWLL